MQPINATGATLAIILMALLVARIAASSVALLAIPYAAFAIFLAVGSPILPDEIIPGLLAILTGKKGFEELKLFLDALERSKPPAS